VLVAGFLAVHLLVVILCLTLPGLPMGDVTLVYQPWAVQAQTGAGIVGIDRTWVYPIVALLPILLPLVAGAANYLYAWLVMVVLLDAVAFAFLIASGRRRNLIAAWWWLGFLALLGPIALGRLDAVAMALAIMALLWISTRPMLASFLLAVATWIKVWPIALVAALVVASRQRWRIAAAFLATSGVIVVLALAWGSGANVLSFVTQQTGRGLQIEAPISVPWLWEAAVGRPGSFIYYDTGILTYQVTGDGIQTPIALMNPLLALAAVVVLLIGLRAVHRKAAATTVLPPLALALVTSFIAFNKVGSPQYVTWLAAPIILGLLLTGRGFRTPAILVGIIAAMTQLIYPNLYDWILVLNPVMLVVLTLRNVMYFVLLGWAVLALWRTADSVVEDGYMGAATVWPFADTATAANGGEQREDAG
jgi:hypothetical protein